MNNPALTDMFFIIKEYWIEFGWDMIILKI